MSNLTDTAPVSSPVQIHRGQLLEGGAGLLVRRGTVERVLASEDAVRRACREHGLPAIEHGDAWLTPGLVNAHAHLELGSYRGRLDPGLGFVGWIRSLVRLRATMEAGAFRAAAREGARRVLATGTTAVADIDSTGASQGLADEIGLRVHSYREVLDAGDVERSREALERVAKPLAVGELGQEALAPHAPYTTSSELLAGLRASIEARDLRVAIHWAESEEEEDWLERGEGPFAEILRSSPGVRGLELLGRHGFLEARTTLVHGNQARPEELRRLHDAGISVVHCPGTHAFFGRAEFPWELYRRHGVLVALGTDSLASNTDLDLTREMALVRTANPGLSPGEVWRMATRNGARALGWGESLGRLAPGARADFVVWESGSRSDREGFLEEVTSGAGSVRAVWVEGLQRFASGD